MRVISRIISGAIFIACLAWYVVERGFEPLITAGGALLGFLSTFIHAHENRGESTQQNDDKSHKQFSLHTNPKLPVLLLIETSGSMHGERIERIKEGIASLRNQVLSNDISKERVELGLVTFGSTATVIRDFVPVSNFSVPDLIASGASALGEGMHVSLNLLNQRLDSYKENGVAYYKPFFFVLTDGNPTDNWSYSLNELHKQCSLKRLNFILVGLSDASSEVLQEASGGNAIVTKMEDLDFTKLFGWVSSSIGVVSQNKDLPLPPITWGRKSEKA